MKQPVPIFVACLFPALLFLSGCLSFAPQADNTRFFVLGYLPDDTPAPGSEAGPFFARPEVPAYLLGEKMVYRSSSGEVKPIGLYRWAEPFEEGVARALARAWSAHTGKPVAGFYPWARPDGQMDVVRVRLHAFGADERGQVILEANWERSGPAAASGRFSSRVEGWRPGDAEGLVEAMNTLLERLAEAIADL